MKNHLDILLKEANRTTQGDNRTRAVKNLNMLIELGVKVVICKKDYMWTTKKGYDYNFKLSYKGRSTVWLIKERSFNAYNMLVLAGRFLKRPEVKELIRTNIETPHDCSKCGGNGIITHFMHYAEGVCFDCGGSGLVFNKDYKKAS
jgi:hypothetical protein